MRPARRLLLLLPILLFLGCEESSGPQTSPLGWISIRSLPTELDAPWTLTGAAERSAGGDTLLSDMPIGEYFLTWGAVPGWQAPDVAQVMHPLADGDTLFFVGEYVEDAPTVGTIVIDPDPDTLEAGWTLTGALNETGAGDSTIVDAPTGFYTMYWSEADGWTKPANETLRLDPGDTIIFAGGYEEIVLGTGTINIHTGPDALNAPWSLYGPQPETGNGDAVLTDMPEGEYGLVFEEVDGYITPALPPLNTLADGGEISFAGVYVPHPGATAVWKAVYAGTFSMGSPTDEPGRFFDEARHEVTLTRLVRMQSTEVSNRQFAFLAQWALAAGHCTLSGDDLLDAMDGSTERLLTLGAGSSTEISFVDGIFVPDEGKKYCPVLVTWYGAAAYCDWLSLREGLTRAYDHADWSCNGGDPYGAAGYRLPTEAEWERACRAGSETAFCIGPISSDYCDDSLLARVGWYCGNRMYDSGHPVGGLEHNAWGLHDMHGNVYEWCNDLYGLYTGDDETDPVGETVGGQRVVRGGCWGNYAPQVRSAFRNMWNPSDTDDVIGFRPVITE